MTAAVATIEDDVTEFRPPPLRARPTRRIRDDAEALAVAEEVSAKLAEGAAARDRDRILPYEEMDLISDAGLLAITVPKAYGGAGVRAGTVARVIAALSRADGSIGQIPQNHFFMLEGLRLQGTEEQKRFFYGRVLAGERLGNALSEIGTKTAHDHATRLTPRWRRSIASTAASSIRPACCSPIGSRSSPMTRTMSAQSLSCRGTTKGITIVDDWSGFGQRTTGSGTTLLDNVEVHPFAILSFAALFERPTSMGPFAQIMHAAVEQGIAEAALADTVQFVRHSARPAKDAGVDRASDDPYTVAIAGELKIRVDASSALLDRAGEFVDRAQAEPSVETVAAASVAVAEAKIASTEAALLVASKLIELAGSSATLTKHGLDRHWRNARTHTVHDPVRWKYRAVGDYWLNGVNPPRHGAI